MRILSRLRPLLLATVLALSGAGAASAQTTPEACDPNPADEVASSMVNGSQKHLALFDVYWDYDDDADDPNSKTLINNPCPPIVVHAQSTDPVSLLPIEITTRSPSDIDIGHTIIHIPSSELQQAAEGDTSAVRSFKRTVTADGTGDYDGADYNFLRPLQDDGTRADSAEVWVVPSCEEEEERGPQDPGPTALDPPLCLGFSAGLLQPGDWNGDIQYEFEAIREPGHATTGYGDFFVFHVENGTPNILWRTDEPDTNAYGITPGTYDHAYWAFTEPGTYVFHVQVKGHPNSAPSVGDPLIDATTVTSEVRRYTFHVGDLAVNHDPVFEVERSVSENATGGTQVGAPVVVHDLDATTLCFVLSGHGAQNFTLEGTTGTDECGTMTAVTENADGQIGAQITVKERSYLDYETTPAYDLRLQVTDGQDPESNLDPSIDDSIAVRLAVNDGPDNVRGSALALHVPASATVGESITLSASFVGGWPAPPDGVTFAWRRRTGGFGSAEETFQTTTRGETHTTVTADQTGTVEYLVQAKWYDSGSGYETVQHSVWVTVHWQ